MISKGVVEERYPNDSVMSGLGSVVSFANYINEKAICDVVAITKVQAYWVPAEIIRSIAMDSAWPEFESSIYKGAVLQFLKANANSFDQALDEEAITTLANGANLLRRGEKESFQLRNDVFLFSGQLIEVESGMTLATHNPFKLIKSNGCITNYTTGDAAGTVTVYLEFDGSIDGGKTTLGGGKVRASMIQGNAMGNMSVGAQGVKNSIIANMDSQKDISKRFEWLVDRKFANVLRK